LIREKSTKPLGLSPPQGSWVGKKGVQKDFDLLAAGKKKVFGAKVDKNTERNGFVYVRTLTGLGEEKTRERKAKNKKPRFRGEGTKERRR